MKNLCATLITLVQSKKDKEFIVPFHINLGNGNTILNNYLNIIDKDGISICESNSDGDGCYITMSKSLFDQLSMNTLGFIICHEIGHTSHVLRFDNNGNILPQKKKNKMLKKSSFVRSFITSYLMELRKINVKRGKVLEMELEADNFAAKYFNAIVALEEMKTVPKWRENKMTIMELDNRINAQLNKKDEVVAV